MKTFSKKGKEFELIQLALAGTSYGLVLLGFIVRFSNHTSLLLVGELDA